MPVTISRKDTQTPTITAGAYAAGDAVGGLLTFANMMDFDPNYANDFKAVVTKLLIEDKASHTPVEFNLILFDSTFTPTADNSPFPTTNPTETFLGTNFQGHIPILTDKWVDLNGCNLFTDKPMLEVESVDGNIYGQLVAVGAPTFESTSDLVIVMFTEFLFNG